MCRVGFIHQPHFLPWLGIAESMLVCDHYVVYDDVQYEIGGYQNRTRVLVDSCKGRAGWLTVPVLTKGRYAQKLIDVAIAASHFRAHGLRRILKTLEQNYGDAPYFGQYYSQLADILQEPVQGLVPLNMRLLEYLKTCLRAQCILTPSSSLKVSHRDRSLRIATICGHMDINVLYTGSISKGYLNHAEFAARGIDIVCHAYETRHEVYSQTTNCGKFIPCLSWVDMLFNCGHEKMRGRLVASGQAKLAEHSVTARREGA
jgi:hypothetical protein